MKRPSRVALQRGLSLIELLAGLTIGLMVVTAAMVSLAHMRTASLVVGDSTHLQQEATIAFRLIGSAIRQAGARHLGNIPDTARVQFNLQYKGYGVRSDNQHAWTIRGTDGPGNKPDTLEISRDPGLWESEGVDCLGEITNKDEEGKKESERKDVTNAFNVVADRLSCDGSGPSQGTYGVVSGVEDFQVWYGLREGDTLRYTTASALSRTTPPPWDQVESVRVCLRLVGESRNPHGVAITGCHGETIASDGRLRRVFFHVFKLRNAGL